MVIYNLFSMDLCSTFNCPQSFTILTPYYHDLSLEEPSL